MMCVVVAGNVGEAIGSDGYETAEIDYVVLQLCSPVRDRGDRHCRVVQYPMPTALSVLDVIAQVHGDGHDRVIELVNEFDLERVHFHNRSEFAERCGEYIKRVAGEIQSAKRQQAFMLRAHYYLAQVLEHYSEYEFYTGHAATPDCAIIMCRTVADSQCAMFEYFYDGLEEAD